MFDWRKPTRRSVSVVENPDAKLWRRSFVKFEAVDSVGRKLTYNGEVLEPTESPAPLTLSVRASVLRPSFLQVPLRAETDLDLEMRCEDRFACRHSVKLDATSATSSAIRSLNFETTDCTVSTADAQLRLIFTPTNVSKSITVLLTGKEPDYELALIQPFAPGYFAAAASFYILSWLVILSAAFIVSVMGRKFEAYVATGAVLTLLLAWLGFPGLDKLPVREYLRKTFSKARINLGPSLACLAVLALVTCSYAGYIGLGVLRRLSYSNLIHDQLEAGDSLGQNDVQLRRAFAMVPWRKEAPAIFEARVRRLRENPDEKYFRDYVRSFAHDKKVRDAISQAATSGLPYYLRDSQTTEMRDASGPYIINPVVWYAAILPDGEDTVSNSTTERTQAVGLLSVAASKGSHEAALYKAWLEVSLAYNTPKRSELISELEKEFRSFGRELRNREVYQVVADTLACDAIDNNRQDEAIQLFRDELRARKGTTRIPWLRPPQKSRLYWMFFVFAIQDGRVGNLADNRLEAAKERLESNAFGVRLRNEVYKIEEFKSFQDPAYWDAGVFSLRDQQHENTTRELIDKEMLPYGWRY